MCPDTVLVALFLLNHLIHTYPVGEILFLLLFNHSVVSSSLQPMNYSTPGFLVLHNLLEFAQTHLHWVSDAIEPSHPLLSYCLQSFPASGSFLMSHLFSSGGQSIGASASASVLPMYIQGWFPLGLTSLISLLSKGLLESSPAPQFKSISSSALSFPYDPPLTSIHYCPYLLGIPWRTW